MSKLDKFTVIWFLLAAIILPYGFFEIWIDLEWLNIRWIVVLVWAVVLFTLFTIAIKRAK